ncbi:MAG TPA: hypothetical protein VEQ59_15315, partial [Polyangiaceae bacterium]|nr:hypothetical protein [Polyangiaceae bacterium]
ARTLENSATIAKMDSSLSPQRVDKENELPAPSPSGVASAHSAPSPLTKKSGTKAKPLAPLERRHDERYGRFE